MHRLPNYARRVEYIQSSGTQYIDTGVYVGPGSRSETDVAVTDWDASTYALSGTTQTDCRHAFGKGWSGSSTGTGNPSKLYFGLGEQNYVSSISLANLVGVRHVYWIDAMNKRAGMDDRSFSLTSTGTIGACRTTSLLLAQSVGSSIRGWMSARLYGCRYYESGALVRSFVPCCVGQTSYLWDEVTGAFYGNAGSGAFVLGTDVAGGGVNASASRPLADGRDAPMTRLAQTIRTGGRRHEKPRPALPARQTVEGRHAA